MRIYGGIQAAAASVAMFAITAAHATSYYISASVGSDTNDGLTPATAWQSTGKINSTAFATGDRVYLEAGDTWTISGTATINIAWSGTAPTHVILGAYHTDGNGNPVIGPGSAARPQIVSNHAFTAISSTHTSNSPYDWTPAINVTGSYVEVRDIETDNWGEGLSIDGASNVTINNFKTSAPYNCGISIQNATTLTIASSEVTGDNQGYGIYNDRANHWCSGIAVQYTNSLLVQANFIHEGYGEGVNIFSASKGAIIEENVIYAQRAVGLYAGWAQDLDIRRNLVFGTADSRFWRSGTLTGPGIAISNEPYELDQGRVKETDLLKNINVYDNLVAGTGGGFTMWYTRYPPSTGGADLNVSVYNNTFVDNGTQIAPAKCTTCIVENNIFLSLSSNAADLGAGNGSGGMTFHDNYWSMGNPGSGIGDPGTDIYSGLTLAKMSGWQSVSSVSALPSWQSFAPLSGSTTLQRGTALLSAPYNVDYNGNPHRNPMDLGALSGSGGSTAPPVAAFGCAPLAGTAPLAVSCTDNSSNSPTNWSWTFGDGGTSAAQNPSHTYSSVGTYTVALAATNSGGSNTTTKTGYITVAAASGGSVTPNPASAGQTITVTDTFTPNVTDGSALVVFWIDDSSNNLLGRCGVTSTSLTSGQPKTVTCTLPIPAAAASGTYHASGTVYQSSTDLTVRQSIPTFATFTIS